MKTLYLSFVLTILSLTASHQTMIASDATPQTTRLQKAIVAANESAVLGYILSGDSVSASDLALAESQLYGKTLPVSPESTRRIEDLKIIVKTLEDCPLQISRIYRLHAFAHH